jgi:hypothetical protein
MKKILVLVMVLTLLVPAAVAFADPDKNPNAEVVTGTCEGLGTFEVVVTGSAGHTDFGIAIPRSLYADGELVFEHPGKGYDTVWCEWAFEGDPTQYSGEVQFAPPSRK